MVKMQPNIYAGVLPLPESYESRTLKTSQRNVRQVTFSHYGPAAFFSIGDGVALNVAGACIRGICWDDTAGPGGALALVREGFGISRGSFADVSAYAPIPMQGRKLALKYAAISGDGNGDGNRSYECGVLVSTFKPTDLKDTRIMFPGDVWEEPFTEFYVRGFAVYATANQQYVLPLAMQAWAFFTTARGTSAIFEVTQ